jgi:hypothetical protein
MKRKDYKGTCSIRYYDVYLLYEMMGIYEEFSKRKILSFIKFWEIQRKKNSK